MQRSWLVPLSSAFCVVCWAILAGVVAGPGCQTRCFNTFDCGPGSFCAADGRCETECFTDLDCRAPIECGDNPTRCRPKGLSCNGQGKCTGQYEFATPSTDREIDLPERAPEVDGWEDPPGTGVAFIVDTLAVARPDQGFDLDGDCDDSGCIDNQLSGLAGLGNDSIYAGVRGGESLLLIEIMGLDENNIANDPSITVNIYSARDADDPFFPANNFRVPDGQSSCCEFTINPKSLVGGNPPTSRARAPATMSAGNIRSLVPVPIEFTVTVGAPPHQEVRLEQVKLSGRLASNLRKIDEGVLGGAVPLSTLAQIENPYCRTISPQCPVALGSSTLLDLVNSFGGPNPDIDLDDDGLECILDTNGDRVVDTCCDGSLTVASCPRNGDCAREVTPLGEGRPAWQCAQHPNMADGYSIAFTFTAVAARILGIGQ